MRALLDTHAFLWWITDDPRLSPRAREVLHDRDNDLYFSAASGWEIAIKVQLGRLRLVERDPAQSLVQFVVEQLSKYHRSPAYSTASCSARIHSAQPSSRSL